jgi:hypothetical protein
MEGILTMKTKRIFAILLSAMFIFVLAGCNGDTNDDAGAPDSGAEPPAQGAEDPADEEPAGFTVTGRYDLMLPADQILNPTLWCWVSDGMDDIFNDKDPAEFQRANYLVLECAGEINPDARAGMAWMSSAKKWNWHEDHDGFNLANFIVDDNKIVLPLYELLDEYTDYKFGDLEDENVIKIYFRYGNERDDDETDFIENLEITAVYFAQSFSV